MRNPIHKRLEHLESWQHIAFMLCLCERMYPNFQNFCHFTEQSESAKRYHTILNLVWEYLTVKGVKINFESQLEKFETVIPDINAYDFYGIYPAVDACEGLAELLHSIIAGSTLEQAIKISQLSLKTVATLLEAENQRELSENELKQSEVIQEELDIQWAIYRALNQAEERDINLLLELKNEIREQLVSNIGIEIIK